MTRDEQAAWYAYAVDANRSAVLVRCESAEEASEEVARLKMSDSRTVGRTRCTVLESYLRTALAARGVTVTTVRAPGSFTLP